MPSILYKKSYQEKELDLFRYFIQLRTNDMNAKGCQSIYKDDTWNWIWMQTRKNDQRVRLGR